MRGASFFATLHSSSTLLRAVSFANRHVGRLREQGFMRLCGMRLRLARLCGILWLPALAAEGAGAPPPPALWPSDAAELLGEALARHHMMSNSGAPSDGGVDTRSTYVYAW